MEAGDGGVVDLDGVGAKGHQDIRPALEQVKLQGGEIGGQCRADVNLVLANGKIGNLVMAKPIVKMVILLRSLMV